MLDEFLIGHIWTGPALYATLYCSDYVLTMRCVRLLRSGADRHFGYEIYELNPLFQKDVAQLRRFSPRFVVALVLTCLGFAGVWAMVSQLSPPIWDLYRWFLGALVLGQVAVHLRHFNNLAVFWHARDSRGYQGKINVATWLSYRLSALQLLAFAAVYLFLFAMNFNWFFAGGRICFAG